MRETELLPFDDFLLEANVTVLTLQINRVPHKDKPTHQDIKRTHEGLLDEYQTSLFPLWYIHPLRSSQNSTEKERTLPPRATIEIRRVPSLPNPTYSGFYLAFIESRNYSRCTPGVRYIYLLSLESSLSRPVLPLLDCRPQY